MSYEETAAQRYRERAEELRTIADMSCVEDSRRTLRGVADDYDRMAETMEIIDVTRRSLEKRH